MNEVLIQKNKGYNPFTVALLVRQCRKLKKRTSIVMSSVFTANHHNAANSSLISFRNSWFS